MTFKEGDWIIATTTNNEVHMIAKVKEIDDSIGGEYFDLIGGGQLFDDDCVIIPEEYKQHVFGRFKPYLPKKFTNELLKKAGLYKNAIDSREMETAMSKFDI